MGKVTEKVRLTNVFDESKSAEIDAVVDTGATMLVLPTDLVEGLGLRRIRQVRVRYVNNHVEPKWVCGIVAVEIQGRSGNFDVLAEESGSQPLIGQMVLEELDLVVNPRTRSLTANPESPDMPTVEIVSLGGTHAQRPA